jgi:hypothetical protein
MRASIYTPAYALLIVLAIVVAVLIIGGLALVML